MTARYRSRDFRALHQGTYTKWWLGVPTTYTDTMLLGNGPEDCSDEVGDWEEDNLLDVNTRRYQFFKLEGTILDAYGNPSKRWIDYPIAFRPGAYDPRSYFGNPDLGAIASEAAARSNPSRPVVNLPAVFGEARELPALLCSIPDLLHARGRGLMGFFNPLDHDPRSGQAIPAFFGSLGDANLAWRFGWRPMWGDLMGMLGVLGAVDQRLRMLLDLLRGKSIKRRFTLPVQSGLVDYGVKTTHSNGIIVKHRMKVRYWAKSWVTTRWSLQPGSVLPTLADDMLLWALRHAYGITSYDAFCALWELIPWSWLVDWFWNLGNFLAANNNSIPLQLVSICWMRTSRANTLYDLVQPPTSPVRLKGEMWQEWEAKQRRSIPVYLALLPPFPRLPALGPGKLSILGSLLGQGRR